MRRENSCRAIFTMCANAAFGESAQPGVKHEGRCRATSGRERAMSATVVHAVADVHSHALQTCAGKPDGDALLSPPPANPAGRCAEAGLFGGPGGGVLCPESRGRGGSGSASISEPEGLKNSRIIRVKRARSMV